MKSQVRNCFTVHIKHHSTAEEDWFNNEVVVTQIEKAEIKEGERLAAGLAGKAILAAEKARKAIL